MIGQMSGPAGLRAGIGEAEPITFALTSCGRFDLLAATLASFRRFNRYPMQRMIVIEDSGDEAVREVCARIDPAIEVMVNPVRLGHMASLDRLYGQITTEFVFHCEDDWAFHRSGFVEDSLLLLKQNPSMSMVSCRGIGPNDQHNRMFGAAPKKKQGPVAYRFPPPFGEGWEGYSFNPGLRRLSDLRAMGRFCDRGSEKEVGRWFAGEGMRIGFLARPACETTGYGNHAESYVPRRYWRVLKLEWKIRRRRIAFGAREMMRALAPRV